MSVYNLKDIKPKQFFSRELFLDEGYVLLAPETPVTEELVNRLTRWEFRELKSEGVPMDAVVETGQGEGEGEGAAVLSDGRRIPFSLTPAPSQALDGYWTVDLASPTGRRKSIELYALASLSRHEDPWVRFFSGTATYRKKVVLPPASLAPFHSGWPRQSLTVTSARATGRARSSVVTHTSAFSRPIFTCTPRLVASTPVRSSVERNGVSTVSR